MIVYGYVCDNCEYSFEQGQDSIDLRDVPTTQPCPRCDRHDVRRAIGYGGFTVTEGGCGNAANGYSSTLGDSENFKARQEGRPIPYGDDCKISEI